MAEETPFFMTKVVCPVCKTANEFETIKVGAYTESGRDTDFCPTGRTWRNPRYQAYNPLLYFTATCKSCFYTREFTREFKEWKSDSYFKTYRQKVIKDQHLGLLSEPESVIRLIGDHLDPKRHPNETAILKLILAIIDERLIDKSSDLDLARFYLRIAWIFREMEKEESPNHQSIKSYLIEADNKLDDFKHSVEKLKLQLHHLENAIGEQFSDEHVASELKSILYPIKDKYDSEIGSIREIGSVLDAKIDALEEINEEHKKVALGSSGDMAMPGFHEFGSFYEFLGKIAQKCEGAPKNEKEALENAVICYRRAFEDGRSIEAGNQQIQASYLIAELSRRIGQHEQAKDYFNTTIRQGQELIYRNKGDRSKTALARKILELAIEQARLSVSEANAG